MTISSELQQQLNRMHADELAFWLHAGGRIAEQLQSRDWSTTSLGPIDLWPTTLRTTLNLILNSPFPMFVAWGEEMICFYNDAHAPLLPEQKDALGLPLNEVFPDTFDRVGGLCQSKCTGW